jgi:hypothetical protein
MSRRKSAHSVALAASLGGAGLDTAVTLWHRLPMLASAYGAQSEWSDTPELNRMVTEKTAAMVEGAFAAQMEIVKLAGAAMTGSLKVQDIQHMPAAIAAAGLRSAFRTVKANSRRLSRRR